MVNMELALSSLTCQYRQQRIPSLCVGLGVVPLLWAWGSDCAEWLNRSRGSRQIRYLFGFSKITRLFTHGVGSVTGAMISFSARQSSSILAFPVESLEFS